MTLTDPRSANTPWYARWALPLLEDPRDGAFVALMMQCAGVAAAGISLFFAGHLLRYAATAYVLVLYLGVIDRFTLMLHCAAHRPFFRREHRLLNQVVPRLLAPFFGQTPETYFAHHIGMHHPEENLAPDASSTLRYRRDALGHWLRYWGRFMALGTLDLSRYLLHKRRYRLFRRILAGEALYWLAVAALLVVNPAATAVVFVMPVLVMRTLMMVGNWAQHAFVCPERPDDPYRASLTCINTRYNRRCFNDGYHAVHHTAPRCHWTEHPASLERSLAEHARHDAVVLEGLDYFQVWALLVTHRWDRLARAYVRLPGAPPRSHAEVVALLRHRVQPIVPAGTTW